VGSSPCILRHLLAIHGFWLQPYGWSG
jgi:hypothetical protein